MTKGRTQIVKKGKQQRKKPAGSTDGYKKAPFFDDGRSWMKQEPRKEKCTKREGTTARFTRRIPLTPVLDGGTYRPEEERMEMVVQGIRKGAVEMKTADGHVWYCRKRESRGALFGDRVLVRKIGRENVEVIEVIERTHEQIIGVLQGSQYGMYIEPLERHLPREITVTGSLNGAAPGEIVKTKVTTWEAEMMVKVIERIGSFDHASAALDGIIEAQHLRTVFPPEAMAQADACKEATPEDAPEREDLRGICSFTIDGRDAKDFDDAVSLNRKADGSMELGVHIADVGHYVKKGSALDREAFKRGTSVYLPGRVLPMLPEKLSNGVCSLRPDEDKYTLSALIRMNGDGRVVDMRIARTITRSKARLIYDDVNTLFKMGEFEGYSEDVTSTLFAMRELACKIRKNRQEDGCIDFDTEEAKFVLDETGEPIEIGKRERGEAEMMIEDFMLTANMCVARLGQQKKIPLLYRVHEKPDPEKLRIFADFLSGIGVDAGISKEASSKEIRTLLEKTKDREEYTVISALALRSMQKARYDVQPLGHYGLAMNDYCHFTSPIRRYPDLVVSRALTHMILEREQDLYAEELNDAAIRSSDCERKAVEAERAADKMMMARFMAGHVGEVFDGRITGVSEWGIYVGLENGAEGFIPVRTLDDWFAFDEKRMMLIGERTGVKFSLGQAMRVRVAHVELTTSAVDLELTKPLKKVHKEKSARKKERERMKAFLR